jgi:alpha-L-fucosidase 2
MTARPRTRVRNAAITAALAVLISGSVAFVPLSASAATPSTAQQWTDVQALVGPIKGVWTDQTYPGQTSDTMPDTALIGNGDVGVSSGGGEGFKTFNFGKNDFWRGNPSPGITGIGGVRISPNGSTSTGTFREEENILKGDIDTTMSLGGVPVTMKTWIASDSNVVVTQITSNGGAVQLKSETFAGTADNGTGFTNTSGVQDVTAWATRTTPSGSKWVSKASLATRVIGATPTATASGGTAKLVFTLPAGGTVRVVTGVAGGGQNPSDPAPTAWTLAGNQTTSGLDSLYNAKVDWWKQYWLKSYIDFNDPVLEKYYYGHLYILGSASRAGKVAPTLYGPWVTDDSPQFHGDAHLNYNWQADFYGAYSSNRPELALPMFDLVAQYLPEARRRAQQDLNRVKPDYISSRFPSGGLSGGGVLFPVGIGPWGSTTDDNYWQQVADSLFTVTQYISYYDYTQDTSWLSATGYPFMKEVEKFFEQYLEFDSASQQYRLYSGPHEGTWARNSTADIGMLKSLLTSLNDASIDLNVDSGLRSNWLNIASKLPATATTTNNGVTVYALGDPGTFVGGDTRAFRPGDNTVNLEFVHPGNQLSLSSSSADRNRAIDTLDQMNSWGQNNSFPKVFTQAAHVGYPAQSLIDKFKAQVSSKTAANLRVKDPNHGIEKAGAIESLDELMLQTDGNDTLRVFPVWPAGNNASFVKLRATGAVLVSSALSGGTVQYVDVTAEKARTVKLLSPWSNTTVSINRVGGGSTSYTVSGSTISFAAAAGATYTITGTGSSSSGVTFYQDTNFGGTAVTLGAGSYSTAQMTAAGVPNNWVSSLRIPTGYTVVAYDGDLSGTSWTYTSDNANFVTSGNNDQVSSFVITAPGGSSTPTFYKDINFGGTSVSLGAGTYNTAQMTAAGVPNNWVSSIRVPAGYTVVGYDGDLSGTSWTYTGDNSNLVNTGNNDLISSLVVTAPGGGSGANIALTATASASSSHGSFPSNRAISGTWASGYEGWVSEIGKPQWLELDLGSTKTFNHYVIKHDGAARPAETANNGKDFTVQVSTNGSTWVTVDTVTGNTASTTDRTFATQSARYVRVYLTEPTQGTTSDSINNPRGRIGQFELYNS